MPTYTREQLKFVGAHVIRQRIDRGIKTKKDLAARTGLSDRVIGGLESGKRPLGDTSYSLVELAIGWPAGTIQGYLQGWGSLLDDEEQQHDEAVAESVLGVPQYDLNTRRPENVSDEQWRSIVEENMRHLDYLIDKAARER